MNREYKISCLFIFIVTGLQHESAQENKQHSDDPPISDSMVIPQAHEEYLGGEDEHCCNGRPIQAIRIELQLIKEVIASTKQTNPYTEFQPPPLQVEKDRADNRSQAGKEPPSYWIHYRHLLL